MEKRRSLLVKTIELTMGFAQRLLQGSMLCTMVIVIFLFIIIWCHISNLTSEIRFPKFCLSFQSAENVSVGRDLLWRSRAMSFMLFNSWFNPSGYKVFSFKTQKFSLLFKSILVSLAVVCFLICSIKVNSAYSWKVRFCLLKCLHTKIEVCDLASFIWSLRQMVKGVALFPTY